MKTREELLAIIEPLYAATPMHYLAVNFIVDFLLLHRSVAVECIRETPVLGEDSMKEAFTAGWDRRNPNPPMDELDTQYEEWLKNH